MIQGSWLRDKDFALKNGIFRLLCTIDSVAPCLDRSLLYLVSFSISDIDECDKYAGLCPQGTCVNLKGSWMCRCDAGYEGTAENQKCQGKNCSSKL